MVKSIHRRAALAAISTVALLLSGCTPSGSTPSGSTPSGSTPSGSTPSGSTPSGSQGAGSAAPKGGTLVFASWQWLEGAGKPGARGDALWKAVNLYTHSNPAVTLVQSATPNNSYADKLNTQLGAGIGPDLFVVVDSQFETLAAAGLLEPLDDAVKGSDLNSTNKAAMIDGKQLGVTWEQVSYALLGNKNVMSAAGITKLPTTVDELIADGKLVKATGADGFAVRTQMSEFGSWQFDFPVWPFGQGGSWSDGKALTINSPENVKGLTEYKRVLDSGIWPTGDTASVFREKFKQNKLGFTIDNSGAALSLVTGGAITGKDMISGPLPFSYPGQHNEIMLAVNAKSKNKELATDFILWFVSKEGQTALRAALGPSTMGTDTALDASFATANPWAQTYIDLGAKSRSNLIAGFETKTTAIMQTVLNAVGRVIQGEDPKTALDEAQQQALKQ